MRWVNVNFQQQIDKRQAKHFSYDFKIKIRKGVFNCLLKSIDEKNIGPPDPQILFLKGPFLQSEQILLTKNFRQYLETIIILSKVLRMGIK